MALDIAAIYRAYSGVATLDGQTQQLQDLPRRRIGFDAERSSCDLLLRDVPDYDGGEDGTVDVGWNGQTQRFFTGIIQSPAASSPGMERSVKLVDKLGLLIQKSFGSDITWSSSAFDDAVTDVLTAVGVASSDIAVIYDPGITLGGTYSITISKSESPAEVFRQLMDYGGTRAVVFPNGKVYVLNISGIPSASYARLPTGAKMIYAYNPSSNELPLIADSWVLETIENPVVTAVVTGPTRSDGVTPSGSATLTGTGRTWTQYYRFLQDGTTANTIADRELSRRAVPRREVQIQADSNPYLMPGMTVGFRDSNVGISTTTPAFVYSVAIDGPTMTVVLWMGLHIIDGPTIFPPPIAVPTIVSIEQEPVIISGSTVTRYFVQMDGTASVARAGYIATYTWTATGATPSSSTDTRPLFVYTTLDGSQQITLQVEDTNGQTNSVTITLPASTSSQIVRRQLLIAEGTNGLAFMDTGTAFTSFTRAGRSCTAVPTINQEGSLLSGWDDGGIWKIKDDRTDIEVVTTLAGGQVNAIWVNESNGNAVVAGAGNKLYRSTNGTTFTEIEDLGATVNDCQDNPTDPNNIRVAADRYVKMTQNGVDFTTVITGTSGTTARMIATAPWGHACVFTGGAAAADAIKFEEGYSVDWTAVASPPTALRTVTALLDTEGFVVGDGSGKLYKLLWDGSGFDATDLVTISGTPSIDDGIRDGMLRGLHYYATTGGTKKLVNLDTIYDVRTNASKQVGYGKIGRYVQPGTLELICPTTGIASGGVWHFVPGSDWTLKNTGLPAGTIYNVWLSANPFNPDKWLFLINTSNSNGFKLVSNAVKCADSSTNPLWYTSDAGANWSAVSMTLTSSLTDFAMYNVEWSTTTDGGWLIVGAESTGAARRATVFRGSNGSQTSSFADTAGDWFAITYGIPGLNNDIVLFENDSPGGGATYGRLGRVAASATDIEVMFSYFGGTTGYYIERVSGVLPTIYGANQAGTSDRVLYLPDYRSVNLSASHLYATLTNSPVYWLTSTASGDVFCGGRNSGGYVRRSVLKLDNFTQDSEGGTSATETVITATALTTPEAVGMIRAGRQKRIALAARIITSTGPDVKDFWVSTDEGVTWARQTGPAAAGANDLDNFVEVLERGGE